MFTNALTLPLCTALYLYYMRWRCSRRKNAWFTGNEFREEGKKSFCNAKYSENSIHSIRFGVFWHETVVTFFFDGFHNVLRKRKALLRWNSPSGKDILSILHLVFHENDVFFLSLSRSLFFFFKCAFVVCKFFQKKNWRIVIAVLHLTKKKKEN